MLEAFQALTDNDLAVVLGEHEMTVYFSKTHIIDLKAVLDAESNVAIASPESAEDSVLMGTD